MPSLRLPAALLTAGVVAALLTGCGSDGSSGSPAGGGSGGLDGPCDVTDRATVASVFPGASDGKPGQARNCTYRAGATTVNIYLFDGDLDGYKKQAKDNDISFSPLSVGDAAIRDQLHSITVQQGDVLFGVQALGGSVQEQDLAKFDPQTLALATKIAANL